MSWADWPDHSAFEIAVASIRRHSMKLEEWAWTSIAELRPQLAHRVFLHAHELPLVSAFISEKSWYAFTTRRVVACLAGQIGELDPRYGFEDQFGQFKGLPGDLTRPDKALPVEIAHLRSRVTGEEVAFEYETGYASMAPIYACSFWNSKKRNRLPMPE